MAQEIKKYLKLLRGETQNEKNSLIVSILIIYLMEGEKQTFFHSQQKRKIQEEGEYGFLTLEILTNNRPIILHSWYICQLLILNYNITMWLISLYIRSMCWPPSKGEKLDFPQLHVWHQVKRTRNTHGDSSLVGAKAMVSVMCSRAYLSSIVLC